MLTIQNYFIYPADSQQWIPATLRNLLCTDEATTGLAAVPRDISKMDLETKSPLEVSRRLRLPLLL